MKNYSIEGKLKVSLIDKVTQKPVELTATSPTIHVDDIETYYDCLNRVVEYLAARLNSNVLYEPNYQFVPFSFKFHFTTHDKDNTEFIFETCVEFSSVEVEEIVSTPCAKCNCEFADLHTQQRCHPEVSSALNKAYRYSVTLLVDVSGFWSDRTYWHLGGTSTYSVSRCSKNQF